MVSIYLQESKEAILEFRQSYLPGKPIINYLHQLESGANNGLGAAAEI